jgi:hypothetical protein
MKMLLDAKVNAIENNNNLMTVIHQQAYRKAKMQLRQLAQDDPSAILRGLNALSATDRKALGHVEAEACKWIGINKHNILKFL